MDACALVLACGGPAPTSPTPAASRSPQPPARTVTLTGHVFAADTGVPLPGANIYILQGANKGGYTRSDELGTFTLAGLQPGTFTIEVVPQQMYNVVDQEVALTADTSMDFALTPRVPRVFVFSGRVTDINSGAALAGASITVLNGNDESRTTTSGSDGRFRLADVMFGGFVVRVRHDGYDSVFRGVGFTADQSLDIQMRPAMQSLAGTWTGTLTTTSSGSSPQTMSIPELNVTQSGAGISVAYPNTVVLLNGTLRDPSAIASTTEVSGTIMLTTVQGFRNSIICKGTGSFTGTVNWTRLVVVAPQVPFDCGFAYTNVTVSLVRQQ